MKPTVVVCVLCLVLVGCGGGGGGGEDPAPTVTLALPGINATSIPAKTTISAEFNKLVNTATVNATTFKVASAAGPVSGSVVCSGATATFFPAAPLAYNTEFTATLTTDVTDLAGNRLAADFVWKFTTVASAPGDPQHYFPFSQGNSWTFQGLTGFGSSYSNTLSVDGTVVVDGKTAIVVTESNPEGAGPATDAFYFGDADGITYYGSSDQSDPLTPQLAPYQEYNFPTLPGYSYIQVHKKALDFGIDFDFDGINETVDLISKLTVVGFDTQTVPAGTFANCLHFRADLRIVLTLSSDGSAFLFRGEDHRWYAPGVGPVRLITSFIDPDGNAETTQEELTARFTILASGLATADSDTESPGKPAVGSDGTNYLVVTRRVITQFDTRMLGVLVNASGEALQSTEIASGDSGGFLSSNRAAVAFDGSNYLVVFGQNGQIAGQRVTPSGAPLDGPAGFAITAADSNFQPAVAFDGSNYLAVWGKFAGDNYEIYGARITPQGQVLGEFPVFTASGEQIAPAVAFDGVNYLVVWQDTRSGSGPADDTDIYATRVTPAGTVLDPAGLPVSTAAGIQGSPSLVFGGSSYFAVWADARTLTGADIYGARIATSGSVLDPAGIAISTATNSNGKGNPSVTFDGVNYFVGWQTGAFANFPPAGIFAARVSTAGQLLDTQVDGIPLSGLPAAFSQYVYPAVQSAAGGVLAVWINNVELSGESKDLRGVIVPGP